MTKRRTKMIAGLSVAAALTGGSLAMAALPAMAPESVKQRITDDHDRLFEKASRVLGGLAPRPVELVCSRQAEALWASGWEAACKPWFKLLLHPHVVFGASYVR